MNLSSDFLFSQGSLQDFVDCQRRFELRYILSIRWPAIQSEPIIENERFLQTGAKFHHMVHQYLLGVPNDLLTASIQDHDLERWWENFLAFSQRLTVDQEIVALHPEIVLTAPLGPHRLLAKYDLIVVKADGRFLIYDWKTARKPPKRQWLEERLQSRVYPYVLARAGGVLNKNIPVEPDQVEMVYWFAEQPESIGRFPYDRLKFQQDDTYLLELVSRIERLETAGFPMTSDQRRCAFCTYRSLCDRGVAAGSTDDLEFDFEEGEVGDISIDLEQIVEVSF
jgi:hypothetical protein